VSLVEQHLAGDGPPVLLLAGEPGIGKTRLLQEAEWRAMAAGWTVLVGGCRQRGGQDPYSPLVDALARHSQQLTEVRQRAALAGCAWLVRLLPELAAAPIEPLPGWHVSPAQERRLMFLAVTRYLRNVAGPAGTLFLLDDLQWVGADALDLLLALARDGMEAPVRLIGAYRDSEAGPRDPLSATLAGLAGAGLARQRLLRPLSRGEAVQLLDGLLEGSEDGRGQPGPHRLWRERVVERAGGVPFFVVSQAQAVRLGADEGPADAVPWDVAQSVRQRVAMLSSGARDLLGVAAVAGRVAPRTLLLAVAAQAEREALAALRAACHARLLEEEGETAYRFTHDVIREVVEADLGAAQRVLLHRAIARTLEGMAGERPVEALAYHYARAEQHARAAHWLERAGDQAAAGFANSTALQRYTEALARATAHGAGRAVLSRLEEKRADVWLRVGQNAQAQEGFARARDHAGTPARRAVLWCKEGVAWTHDRNIVRALAALDAAESEADGMPPPSTRAATPAHDADHLALGQGTQPLTIQAAIEIGRAEAYYHRAGRGDYDRAVAAAQRVVLLGGDSPGDASALATAHAQHYLASVALYRGDLAHAEGYLQASLRVRDRLADQGEIAWSWHVLGMIYYQQGDFSRADECACRAIAIMERIGDPIGIAVGRQRAGLVRLRQGDLQGAQAWCRATLETDARTGWSWSGLAEVCLAQGDLHAADDYAHRGLALAQDEGDHWTIAVSRIVLGEIACARGDPVAALRSYRAASRLCSPGELVPLEPGVLLGQASAFLFAGRLRSAALLLERARTIASAHGLGGSTVMAAVLGAELLFRRGLVEEAQAAAEEARRLAATRLMRREEARARRVQGECACARGNLEKGESHLRAALAMQTTMGAALDAAITRLALAEALAAGTDPGFIPDEARALLADAQAQFAANGAAPDLARAEHLAAIWGTKG
jgi:tetratricopeptide (TPR) repeat protein